MIEGSDLSGNVCDLSGLVVSSDAQALVETTWGLRLRTHVEELEEDLSGNLQIVHPSVRPPSFEELANAKSTMDSINKVYIQSVVLFLQFLSVAYDFLEVSWKVTKNTAKAIKRSFGDDIYVFFKDSSYPYRLDELKLDSPGVPTIEWYYNAKTTTFITARLYNNSQHYNTHHIPYLSAEIKYNELSLYDISDFVNGIRWAGEEDEGMPTVDHLVSAWTLSSGIVLRRSDTMSLTVINTDGDDVKLPLRNEA